MMKTYRSGFLQRRLFMTCPEMKAGLWKLSFANP
jgi:hypothetical protein